uniref:Spx domain-containing protein n=1 Tax=Tetraselmis sp. GSL018 TaxID=582737 RepID=A0A061SK31_9CHLO|mmetsp:Transcript_2320/g.5484  ORF Transcript_2320/g.5484 Transcript_2320/m.5484 type:complete len:323 (-) Transcript_2320:235-1203(-)|eukprot:CAMPEP_0177611054 /NCGR_PEP_ID=MMETSP0419_2-20121207/20224_1 /TAXON_ID=582737 /ORGANISM="Tetraselmis sp., Strain GSL018" /LENGTH=322 /DNA_ID=CAMNT_0019106633 /DNA_START=103 /DNA_END=1071 /DNA_ORIENTATION=+
MKFARTLRQKLHELPECQSLFEFYKQLKKKLKHSCDSSFASCSGDTSLSGHLVSREASVTQRLPSDSATVNEVAPTQDSLDWGNSRSENTGSDQAEASRAGSVLFPAVSGEELTASELEFVKLLYENLEQFNDTFVEDEETCIIKCRELEDSWNQAETSGAKSIVYKAFINLHCDLLLLMNWSMLAYTSVVKILKKHEKRTGHKLYAPQLESMLEQPFCSAECLGSMVKSVEERIRTIKQEIGHPKASSTEDGTEDDCEPEAGAETAAVGEKRAPCDSDSRGFPHGTEAKIARLQAASSIWKHLRDKRSTPSDYIATPVMKC